MAPCLTEWAFSWATWLFIGQGLGYQGTRSGTGLKRKWRVGSEMTKLPPRARYKLGMADLILFVWSISALRKQMPSHAKPNAGKQNEGMTLLE